MSGIKVTTESGAEYLLTPDGLVTRLSGPWSPGIDYALRPDGEPDQLVPDNPDPIPGKSWIMQFVGGGYRVTTPVVSVTTW